VIYTRALRIDDAPSIASRWLQRLATYVGKDTYMEMVARGDTYLQLSDLIDKGEPVAPSERPQPKPPVSTRPNRLSFTEIETWIRDPYAIYAKHVLKLYALPPLVREADPALRGTLYHEILAKFVEEWSGPINQTAEQKLEMIAADCFDAAELPTEIDAAWRPRFNEIGKQFLKWEASRRETIKTSFCEIDANAEIGDTNFFLRGRADRIDLDHEGKLTVIDYKTGTNPSKLQARTTSPQLTLEGALASRGAFEGVPAAQINQLLYVRLKEGDAFKIDDIASVKKNDEQKTAGELAEFAYEKLIDQIIAYRSAEQGYISQYIPAPGQTYKGDYDHLARIREWSIDASDDEGEED